ncbi:MAG: 2-oxo acid dehydrogenase subunit E2, partial [Actinomycetota bacterium]|nr:2-oxo acid dehydrogenase subunit E2 [Actinomycetota bacterium]
MATRKTPVHDQPGPQDSGPNGAGDAPAGELVDVTFPAMGDSVAEGTILEWRVKVGETVSVDDELVEISTDKVDAEVPSPVAGTVRELLVEADQTVPVGTVLLRIEPGDGEAGGSTVAPAATATDQRPGTDASDSGPPSEGNGDSGATPVAVRMARTLDVDLAAVAGTGPRGRITKEDVEAASRGEGPAAAKAASATDATPAGAGLEPIRGPAATLVRFMEESRSIPTATSFRTLPVDTLATRRAELKAAGRKLSFTHLIAWAIVEATKGMPVMANSFAEVDGKPHRVAPASVNLGLAVDVERKDGTRSLVVPVIHGASEMSFSEFVAAYDEAVVGARDNTLQPDAYQGAQITLTNPGGIGTVASVPRLMPGQGTIVASGAIAFPPGLAQADPEAL